jgi:23S rRNA pseudouridine1911/1915/1917 synthase
LNVNDNVLDLQIITGRTHQIRYHLSQKWLPIIGDKLYWYKEEQPMQLTAYKLDFVDPDGKRQLIQI